MIPLRSSEPHYTRPTVTLLIIAANVAVFLLELSMPSYSLNRFIMHYGIVPDRFAYSSVITSMFIHGGFLFLYFACGIAAALLHVLVNANSTVPTVGASGAIAGVMGAYLIKFPRAHIQTLVFIFIFITTVDIPAFFLLLYWFAIQFFSGIGSVGYSTTSSGDVAWFAHVGGFVAGMLLVMLMPGVQRARPWRSNWRY